MKPNRPYAARVRRLAVLCAAVAITPKASAVTTFLYEPFNYDPATVTQLKGQLPDGIRLWNQAGTGPVGDILAHPAPGNLGVPSAMVGPGGNMAIYGGNGESTRINLTDNGTTVAQDGAV